MQFRSPSREPSQGRCNQSAPFRDCLQSLMFASVGFPVGWTRLSWLSIRALQVVIPYFLATNRAAEIPIMVCSTPHQSASPEFLKRFHIKTYLSYSGGSEPEGDSIPEASSTIPLQVDTSAKTEFGTMRSSSFPPYFPYLIPYANSLFP